MKIKCIFLFALFFSLPLTAADIEGYSVLLRGVDKVTGRTDTVEIPVGETVTAFGSLKITPMRCFKKPPEEAPENAAFLMIEEETRENVSNVVFNGWMLSSDPALSAMEHPIYDIWVLECLANEPLPDRGLVQPSANTIKAPVEINELEEI